MTAVATAPASETTPETTPPSPSTRRRRRSARNERRCPVGLDAVFAEAPQFAGAPLGPLCDGRSLPEAPLAGAGAVAALERVEGDAGQWGWKLQHVHGDISSPLYAPGGIQRVQTGNVLDVYAGLLVELAEADFPADGRVRIGRQKFLDRIQWTDTDGKAGGHAYRQLDAAIEYLAELRIRSTAIERFVDLEPGATAHGELTFRILQGYGTVSELQVQGVDEENRPNAGHRADDLIVYFSSPFVRLLRNSDQRVTYRLSHYLRFRRGAPRALYRYVAYLATQPLTRGAIAVDLDDLLASVGSTLRGVPRARVEQLFRDSFTLLREINLLRALPEYTDVRTADGVKRQVVLRPATPPTDELKDLLEQTLIAWAVTPSIARKYVESAPEWVATIVAATTLGMLEVKRKLPAMVVDYCKEPNRDLDPKQLPRFRPTRATQRRTSALNEAMEYLEDAFEASNVYFRGLHPDDQAGLRSAYAGVNRPDWVVNGLVLAAVHRLRAGWSLGAFLRARGVTTRR